MRNIFTNEHCVAADKHSNCSAAVELVAFGRGGGDVGDGGRDGGDGATRTESPSTPGDESRASREPGWSDTWPKCWGGARRQRPRLRRGADPLATGTGERPGGGDGGGVGDENDDRERRP